MKNLRLVEVVFKAEEENEVSIKDLYYLRNKTALYHDEEYPFNWEERLVSYIEGNRTDVFGRPYSRAVSLDGVKEELKTLRQHLKEEQAYVDECYKQLKNGERVISLIER